jgi:hypothetical protein
MIRVHRVSSATEGNYAQDEEQLAEATRSTAEQAEANSAKWKKLAVPTPSQQ